MTLDISQLLRDWPYENGQVTARRFRGDDGREKIQLRLDMGILQMDVTGRPDGQRPHGQESLLDYHELQLREHVQANGNDETFKLDPAACEMLRAEGVMYYHRYLAQFVLEDYYAVERDTMRNLRLIDFCSAYTETDADKMSLEQYRPYVLMMCTRARALVCLGQNRPKAALAAVQKGLDSIKAFYRRFGQERAGGCCEVAILKALIKEIESRIPVDPVVTLKRKLAKAVKSERYEEAATLRDQINELSGQATHHSEQPAPPPEAQPHPAGPHSIEPE